MNLLKRIIISSLQEAEEILKAAGTEDLFEKAKHQDGDMHPNGKWVWVSSANGGKGDWRTKGGRTHTKHSTGGGGAEVKTDTTSTSTQQKPTKQSSTSTNDFANISKEDAKKFIGKKIKVTDTLSNKTYETTIDDIEDVYLQRNKASVGIVFKNEKGAKIYYQIKLVNSGKTSKSGLKIDLKTTNTAEPTDTTQTKPKKRPIGVGTNGPEKRTTQKKEK